MNKTVTVNIGGIVFHIDENAYEYFKKYLESIRLHFTASEGRDEIMQDIESRIAEMFQARIKDQKQVITLEDVEEVTTLMGKPEQFGDKEARDEKDEAGSVQIDEKIQKRMFRNPDDKLVGGVCSGISAYFGIDPVWLRLIFAVCLFGFGVGFLLYIILWIIIPPANTTTEKLQMRGEPVTINNIEKNVHEELQQVKKKLNDMDSGKKPGNIVSSFFDGVGQIFKFLFLVLGKIIAVFFIFIGLIVSFSVFACLLAAFNLPGIHYPEFFNQVFSSHGQLSLAIFGAVLVVGIPFLMLAYFGASVLFNIRKSSRIVNLSALGLWIGGVVICMILGSSVAKDFSEKQSVRKSVDVIQPLSKTLVLKMDKKQSEEKYYDRWDNEEWNGDMRLSANGTDLQSKDIALDIRQSSSDSFELVQIFYARGSSKKVAAENATHISYSFAQLDSVITFNRYFVISKDEKYRAQKVQLVLYVPVGGKVFLDNTLSGFIYDIKNTQNIFDHDMLSRSWLMTEKGLSCIDCTGDEDTTTGDDFDVDIHGNSIHIDDDGVYIKGSDNELVSIDSNGVVIRDHKGRVKKVKKGNVHIEVDDDH